MLERDTEQLDLAAFRYVAGEMPPDEAVGFEQRLADDQSTREGVSRAVALTEKLVLANPNSAMQNPPDSVSVSRSPAVFWRIARQLTWMTIGAIAASLAFVVAGQLSTKPTSDGAGQPVVDNTSPQNSALPFDANQIDTLAWMEMSDATSWNIELALPEQNQIAPELLSMLDPPTTIPDWILETNGDIE